MTAKTTNIVYWVSTVIFAGLMAFSSTGGLEPTKETADFMHGMLGYPIYFIQFISVAKLLGVVTILIPGISRWIKEWAYAGLFFDLAGAIYSGVAVSESFDPRTFFMLMWVLPGVVSYYFWKQKAKKSH